MRRKKNTDYAKIVDTIVVTDKIKPSDNPLKGGRLEQWWNDDTEGKQGIKKVGKDRIASGNSKSTELTPSVAETLVEYKFKGCEFGNWLSQAERYDTFTAFQRCLADMENWLGSKNIGFDNCFGVAFGARGSRGAAAHYEPWSNMINMTKAYGAGGFLHEYAHAIDYSIGAFFDQNQRYTALSGGHTLDQEKDNVGGQFRAMINKILLYVRSTESYKTMSEVPWRKAAIHYWGNSTELFARLTEVYFAYFYNTNKNYYLVQSASRYEEANKEDGRYLTKAEVQKIKPELDKFWKEVALLLNNKCTLKKTPFPKFEKEKPKTEEPKSDLYSICHWDYTDKTFKKVKEKVGVMKSQKDKSLSQCITMLDHAERGSKKSNNPFIGWGMFVSRTKYSIRRILGDGTYRESFIIDSNGKRLTEPKADSDSSKKKVVKRPDKLNPVWGNFVSKDKNRPPLLYVWEKDNFRSATDMFHLLYEELGDTLPKNHVRVFDKKLGLIYEGNVDECPYGHFPDVQKALVLANNKTATIDTARWQKSLQNLKSIVSENKKKKAILAKETEALKHKVGIDKQSKELVKKQELYLDACNKATWMQHAIFVVNFDTEIVYLKAETVERMLEVGKMWNLNKLFFEQKNRGLLMKSTDKTKQALFMPMATVEEETNPKIATEQKKMIAEKGYYIDKYYM